jgi:hypothetical protein
MTSKRGANRDQAVFQRDTTIKRRATGHMQVIGQSKLGHDLGEPTSFIQPLAKAIQLPMQHRPASLNVRTTTKRAY